MNKRKFYADQLYRFMKIFTWVYSGFISVLLIAAGCVFEPLFGDVIGTDLSGLSTLIILGSIVLSLIVFGVNMLNRWFILATLENYIANIETRNILLSSDSFDDICVSSEDVFIWHGKV